MTIYRYGPLAWLWRALIVAVLSPLALLGAGDPLLVLPIALPLLVPAALAGAVVVTRVDRADDGRLVVWTLLWRRRVRREQLGVPRLRRVYHDRAGVRHAPALWVPVARQLPLYLDLLAGIPDRRLFDATFRAPRAARPTR